MRFVRDQFLADRYDVARTTIWRLVKEGRLPQPIRLSPGVTRWRLSDIEAFEEMRAHDGVADPAPRRG